MYAWYFLSVYVRVFSYLVSLCQSVDERVHTQRVWSRVVDEPQSFSAPFCFRRLDMRAAQHISHRSHDVEAGHFIAFRFSSFSFSTFVVPFFPLLSNFVLSECFSFVLVSGTSITWPRLDLWRGLAKCDIQSDLSVNVAISSRVRASTRRKSDN